MDSRVVLHLPMSAFPPPALHSMSPSAAHFILPSANPSSLHQEIRSPSVPDSREKISWNKPSALSQESLQYTCRFCHKVFLSFRALNGHMRIHGASSDQGSREEGNAALHQIYSLAARFHRSFPLPEKYSGEPDIYTLPDLEEEFERDLEEEEADAGEREEEPDFYEANLEERPVNTSATQETSCIYQLHSKRKPLYELRQNPKRSRVMTDTDFWGLQDIDQCPATQVSSPVSSCARAYPCSMCARTFCSLKALHRHMQSHPNGPLGQGALMLPYSTPSTDFVYSELHRDRFAYSFGDIDTKSQDKKVLPCNARVSIYPQKLDLDTVEQAIGQQSSMTRTTLTSVSLTFEEDLAHSQEKDTETEPRSSEASAAVCLIMLSRGITDLRPSSVIDTSKAECDESIHVVGGYKKQGSFAVARKEGKFQCKTCNRSFKSSQALGGHRASHGIKLKSSINKEKAHANNVSSNDSLHELKRHACSLCQRVFLTGQALGGHMRCHWTGAKIPDYEDAIALNNKEPLGLSPNEPNEAAGTDRSLPLCMEDVDEQGSSSLEKPDDERIANDGLARSNGMHNNCYFHESKCDKVMNSLAEC